MQIKQPSGGKMKKTTFIMIGISIILCLASTAWSKEMRTEQYEKKVVAFTEGVKKGDDFDCLAAKKELIEDLYRTTYAQDFTAKYDSIARYSRGLSFDIESVFSQSKTEDEFKAAKDRYEEWKDFCRLADRAPEDFSTGIIQQYTMDKKREGQLPFTIESVKWEQSDPSSPDIDAFKKELKKVDSYLIKAIKALKKKNEDKFAELFSEKLQLLRKAEPEKSRINSIFKRELEENWKDGMTTEPAPLFVRADLELSAKRFKNRKIIITYLRRFDGEKTKLSKVVFTKENKNYIILSWNYGGADMMNRRR
jgi:hypothetical protein